MDERELFVLADQRLARVVEQIRGDQWEMPVPSWFATRTSDRAPTVREIVGYHAYDEAWVPDMVAGRRIEEVGADSYRGDLLGDDPAASFTALVERGSTAVASLDDLDRTVHCSFGDYPAREYLWQVTTFRGMRAVDIARTVGVDPTLQEPLLTGLWDQTTPHAEEWRSIGVFGPRVDVPDDAPLQDRLLALTGRDPYVTG